MYTSYIRRSTNLSLCQCKLCKDMYTTVIRWYYVNLFYITRCWKTKQDSRLKAFEMWNIYISIERPKSWFFQTMASYNSFILNPVWKRLKRKWEILILLYKLWPNTQYCTKMFNKHSNLLKKWYNSIPSFINFVSFLFQN